MKNFSDELNNLMAMAQNDMTKNESEVKDRGFVLDSGFYDRVGMPDKFRGVTFTTHPNVITERVKTFCTKKEGGILIIIGPVGTGKTETACCSFLERAKAGLPAGEYLNAEYQLCPKYRSSKLSTSSMTEWDFFQHYYKLPFLVLDEVGRGDDKEVERKVITNFISSCYDNLTKIIITTNMTMEELIDFLGDRITDRFREVAEVCVLNNESWRGR